MLKQTISLLLLFLSVVSCPAASYADFFVDKACRVDFCFCGNATQTAVFLDNVKQEPYWGGRRNRLDEDLNLGDFRFKVIDSISNRLVYINGFDALFHEWQSTPEASVTNKSFEQVIQFPFPKKTVVLVIEKRIDFDRWQELFRYVINPDDKLIDKRILRQVPVKIIHQTTTSDKAVDIAVIAEGYTNSETGKFYADAQRLADNLFTHEPFASNKKRANLYAIAVSSEDSGVSVPQDSVWKNTAVDANFYTFYEPRYLTTRRVKRVYDYAAQVPYDAVYILVNTSIYGGGGIFNFYTLVTADNRYTPQVAVHEFGHSFGGLADEYFYDKQDVLAGMYDIRKEPWEPNITTLIHFDKKWQSELPKGTSIPTPPTDQYKTKVGVFEGGGYLTKGMFRSSFDCRMRTNSYPEFCPVCREALERMIRFLTE
jgi:hypothetical protein